jgi:hypothetical protein
LIFLTRPSSASSPAMMNSLWTSVWMLCRRATGRSPSAGRAPAFLLHVRRREVDEDGVVGVREPAVDDRPSDALDALLHRRLGQADDRAFLKAARADVDLDLAQVVVDPDQDEAVNFCKQGTVSPQTARGEL